MTEDTLEAGAQLDSEPLQAQLKIPPLHLKTASAHYCQLPDELRASTLTFMDTAEVLLTDAAVAYDKAISMAGPAFCKHCQTLAQEFAAVRQPNVLACLQSSSCPARSSTAEAPTTVCRNLQYQASMHSVCSTPSSSPPLLLSLLGHRQ